MNFLVILLNGGCMPVAVGLLKSGSERTAQLAAGQIYAYTAVSADTVLPFLGDVLSIAPRGMTIGFASPGDLVLCAGVGLLCFQMTRDTGGGRENGVPGKDSEAEAKS